MGRAVYYGNDIPSVNSSDYNNFFTNGPTLAIYGSQEFSTLADWQTQTGFDNNSLSVDPMFHQVGDFHICNPALNNVCPNFPGITNDLDGDARLTTVVDMGADEFSPVDLGGFLGSDKPLCSGTSIKLKAPPAALYLWNTGATS